MSRVSEPLVSIIMPIFNRCSFLRRAFESINKQVLTDWEVIVVDDGSTDNTCALVRELTRDWQRPVRYIYQANQGAYGARNTGLDQATGKYIAFYDSDDLWLPHHLQDCVVALESNSDVDWVYGSCRIVNLGSGQEIAPSTFYIDGQPRPFLKLANERRGKLRVICDRHAASCHVLSGFYCGLQNSVIRESVFAARRFNELQRNGEDQLIVARLILDGAVFGYFDNVHVEYRIHDENSSAAGLDVAIEKRARVLRLLAEGYEGLLHEQGVPTSVRKAIRQRLGREYFWHLGYSTLWQAGRKRDALQMFHRGLGHWPWDWRCWKTLVTARIRTACSRAK